MAALKISELSRASMAGAVLLVTACLLLTATQALAETVKGRAVYYYASVEVIEVGDVPGHLVGVVEEKGLTFFENGEVATGSAVYTLDLTNGSGTYSGYMTLTFEDGSTQILKLQGTGTAFQEGKPGLFKDTYTYIGGTGRFEGI